MSVDKSYRVSVVVWDVFDYWIDAWSEDEAEDRARESWSNCERDKFRHRHGELDHVEAEEVRS